MVQPYLLRLWIGTYNIHSDYTIHNRNRSNRVIMNWVPNPKIKHMDGDQYRVSHEDPLMRLLKKSNPIF